MALTPPVSAQSPAVFTVDSDGDQSDANTADGVCQTSLGTCTLRAAIEQANARPDVETIRFNIRNADGSCPALVIIQPATTLTIDSGNDGDGLTIDGYTQCGASPNTLAVGGNAVIKIEIRGPGLLNVRGLAVLSPNNVIRGLAVYNWDRNLYLAGSRAHDNLIEGNFFGTDAANNWRTPSSHPVDLRHGIFIYTGDNNLIGGATPAARNIIAGNRDDGIRVEGAADNTRIVGNYIGIKQDGRTNWRNTGDGIDVQNGATNTRIENNVISGNYGDGVEVSHDPTTRDTTIAGNYIGVNAFGAASASNLGNGITAEDRPIRLFIYNNVIAGNGANGIRFYAEIDQSEIHDNLIGLMPDGVTALPNGWDANNTTDGRYGIRMFSGSSDNVVRNNRIAFNHAGGMFLSGSGTNHNRISQNRLFGNTGLGIDLYQANDNIAAPTITGATTTTVTGRACGNCRIEVFLADKDTLNDPSGDNSGEGRTFVGQGSANGSGNFSVAVSGVSAGQIVTATATDGQGNTSEFAANFQVGGAGVTASPAPTQTPAASPTATSTVETRPTDTPTATSTASATWTASPSATASATPTATATFTASPTATETGTPTSTFTPSPVPTGAMITVNTFGDDLTNNGNCSLREAVRAANDNAAVDACPAGGASDTIILPAGVYTLTRNGGDDNARNGDLDLTGDVTITGAGADVTAIDAGGLDRVFHILNNANVAISGVTLRGGSSGNSSGGGLRQNNGTLTLIEVAVRDNMTSADGGGLYVGGGAALIERSLFTNNAAGDEGGAIYANGPSVTLRLTNSTLSGNRANDDGGGLYFANSSASAYLANVTITANTADADANSAGEGGGVYRGSGTVYLKNSIVAGNNDASPSAKIPDCRGAIASQGYNLIGNNAGCAFAAASGDQVSAAATPINANLGPLQSNGGPTLTHALLAGSPAIDGGNPAGCTDTQGAWLAVDQRNQPRPLDGNSDGHAVCDIGAYEAGTGVSQPTATFTASPTATSTVETRPTDTPTPTATDTASATWTASPSATASATPTATSTASATWTASPSATASATPTATSTATSTVETGPDDTPTPTATSTGTSTGGFETRPNVGENRLGSPAKKLDAWTRSAILFLRTPLRRLAWLAPG